MDIQDQTKTNTPSGHESDGVHICHRCGWPFPNSHPSPKHRRAHKRICGTIEGYTKLIHLEPLSDDEQHHSDGNEDKEKTPSHKVEKIIVKESGSGIGGIEERFNRSEDDMFADAVAEFSDSGISLSVEKRPIDATKMLDTPIEVKKPHDNLEILKTPDSDTEDADKTEENDINNVDNSASTQIKLPDSDTKTSVSLGEDRVESHKDNFIDTFAVSDNKDQGEEVHVLSVPSDIPLVDHADSLIDDFNDHKTIYSSVHGEKDAENRSIVDSFEVKTAEKNIEESQISENSESVPEQTNFDLSAFVTTVFAEEATVVETQPLEMSVTIPESTGNLSEPESSSDKRSVVTHGERIETEGDCEEINRGKFESHHEHAQEVIKKCEIDHSVPILTEAYTCEIVKEPESGIVDKQKIVESVVTNSKDSGNVAVSERLEKVEQSHDVSGVVSETVVDESVGSSSRNSVEGNWGSVSVLSTASIDAENAHSIGKSDISMDKSRLGKSYAFEDPALVESKKEIVDQRTEIKAVTVQNSQPPKPEAKVSNETEGRKRNEEAIAKVTNWSTGEHPTASLKNLSSEAKSSNPKQLSTLIQKDEAAEKISESEKTNLTLGTHPVNQDPSPKHIGEGEKVGKKTKGRASWVPFVCCSSVNVN